MSPFSNKCVCVLFIIFSISTLALLFIFVVAFWRKIKILLLLLFCCFVVVVVVVVQSKAEGFSSEYQ
jgi:hypothetical protein